MKLYTKKERIILFVKSFLIIFAVGLFLEFIISNNVKSFITNFSISLGVSIGVAFNDLFFARERFKNSEMSVKEDINAYLSLFMGIIGLPSFPLVIGSLLGVFFGIRGLKSSKNRLAIAGIIISFIGLLLAIYLYSGILHTNLSK